MQEPNARGDLTPGECTYIVVGAGTAGSVVAERLSEEPGTTVLLLEAGSADRPDDGLMPSFWGSRFDWAFSSTPQEGLDGVTVPVPRGRGLGGSSTINSSFHIRGHSTSYDAWNDSGAEGWNFRALLPFFRRSERTTGTDSHWRGTEGPMVVERPPDPSRDEFQSAASAAATQAGYHLLADGNGEETEGAAATELNVVSGARQSVADAYLRPAMSRPNLEVISDAVVRRLVIEDGRCAGVEYAVHGRPTVARAGAEVVLCAGAIGSPQLLLLSGIGPAEQLRSAGVDVVHDLPGVGENLQDHPYAHVGFR
jgi:choline dehydrogenase